METQMVATVVGGGLAGCEAAFQLAERGVSVRLHEMKPGKRTPAQKGDGLAELVCSNSLRGAALTNAVGLLKEELRLAGSLIMRAALVSQVPAGGALAVDRERFSELVTEAIAAHPRITRVDEEVTSIPASRPTIIATGPLTADALAADLARAIGSEQLAYYDAIAPIVDADSIDMNVAFKQSRYGKGGDDYINCPFDREQYETFVAAIVAADKVPAHDFEEPRYFEGCLPCEVMAERGPQTLAFGPMKPVGLTDPRTGKRPHAVLQLRAEDAAGTAYNMVGFQTRMTWPEQKRVFRLIPGLEQASFVRLGAVHRNTFVNAPAVLDRMELKALPGVYLAGQIAGVEGYVESCGAGFVCGLAVAAKLRGEPIPWPPEGTALAGLLTHMARPGASAKLGYQPSNINWSHLPPHGDRRLKKRARYQQLAERALTRLTPWLESIGSPEPAGPTAAPRLSA